MSTPKDGGPAFPYAFEHDGHADISGFAPGMTLRDYFAAKTLSGWLSSPTTVGGSPMDLTNGEMREDLALSCYDMADAMLAARDHREDAR